MVALQIRDVPEDVRQVLAQRARARGQSLQAFLLWLVEQEARRSRNLSLLVRFANRSDGSQLSVAEVTDVLDQARAERDATLTSRQSPSAADGAA
ncbi:MAG: FitA-like ribbon-helix-helix domain-containing protein [Pseudonocardiaceae bacterium]